MAQRSAVANATTVRVAVARTRLAQLRTTDVTTLQTTTKATRYQQPLNSFVSTCTAVRGSSVMLAYSNAVARNHQGLASSYDASRQAKRSRTSKHLS
eukprot:scaffold5178_cov364-Prasinococcus_capsulatus_cf.AAC.16